MLYFQYNVDLVPYTTMGIQAKAKIFVEIDSESLFLKLLESQEWKENKHIFLGTGANILFTQDFDGLVVKVNIRGKKVLENKENQVLVEIGAGENRNEFVERSIDQGWAGLENMIAIPSSVGAAAFGNIGAYGMEAKDRIVSVHGINTATKNIVELTNIECKFDYRESIFKHQFKGDFLITKVQFRLDVFGPNYSLQTQYKDIQQRIEVHKAKISPAILAQAITEIRASKLPDWHTLGTAGSFFTNPIISLEHFSNLKEIYPDLISFDLPLNPGFVKLSAGQLIEKAGFKGYRDGNVGVYDKHALILVNYGGATGQDIAKLAGVIQSKVNTLFHLSLTPEVIYV